MGKPAKTQPRPPKGAAIATEHEPAIIDGSTGLPTPTPTAKRPRHIRLRTIDDVRAEAEKVYRDMRSEKIEPQTGTRLVYVLSQISEMIETADIERRLELLEGSHHEFE